MRAAWILISMCLVISAARGSAAPKDELLSLLDNLEPVVADVNTLAQPADSPAAEAAIEPNLPAEIAVIETEKHAADPNGLVMPSEPNTFEPMTVEPGAAAETEGLSQLEKSRQLRRDFFKVQLEPVKTMTSEEQKQKLDSLIAAVNSLEPAKKLIVVSEDSRTPEPADPVAADIPLQAEAAQEDSPASTVEAANQNEPNSVSVKLLTELGNVETVVDPMQLADVLYRQGHTEAAYTYYRQAFEQLKASDADNVQWVLFQMGNCRCESDPAKALELYTELLKRFPSSPWSAAAQSRRTTLEWTMTEQVKQAVGGGL